MYTCQCIPSRAKIRNLHSLSNVIRKASTSKGTCHFSVLARPSKLTSSMIRSEILNQFTPQLRTFCIRHNTLLPFYIIQEQKKIRLLIALGVRETKFCYYMLLYTKIVVWKLSCISSFISIFDAFQFISFNILKKG